jgi:hypothetical protein
MTEFSPEYIADMSRRLWSPDDAIALEALRELQQLNLDGMNAEIDQMFGKCLRAISH